MHQMADVHEREKPLSCADRLIPVIRPIEVVIRCRKRLETTDSTCARIKDLKVGKGSTNVDADSDRAVRLQMSQTHSVR